MSHLDIPAAEDGPLGFDGIDPGSQRALALWLIGMKFVKAGAARFAKRMRGHTCQPTDPDHLFLCGVCWIQQHARMMPFLMDQLRVFEGELELDGVQRVEELHDRLRVALDGMLKPADEPLTVAGAEGRSDR